MFIRLRKIKFGTKYHIEVLIMCNDIQSGLVADLLERCQVALGSLVVTSSTKFCLEGHGPNPHVTPCSLSLYNILYNRMEIHSQ
jgi:hypothetical protein